MWWHENPVSAGEWLKKKFPERYKKLKALSIKIIKVDWEKEYKKTIWFLTNSQKN